MQTRRRTVFVTLAIKIVCEVQSQTPITCTAGYFKPGDTANITCDYHGDIDTAENSGVYVQWRKLQASGHSSGIEVLTCGFSRGVLAPCNPEDGYKFISFKDNTLIIQVPRVETRFQGRYSCGNVSPSERPMRQCLLVVEGAFGQGKTTEQANDNAERQETLYKHVETTHGVVIFVLIITIVVLVAITAAAVFYVVVARKRNWFPFTKRTKKLPIDDEEADMLGKSDPSDTIVAYKSAKEESPRGPIYTGKKSPPASVPPPTHREPLLQASQQEPGIAGMEESADEKKVETKEERKARLEKEYQARKEELKKRLKDAASKEEKKQIQKEFDEKEKSLKQQRKEEEKHWEQQKKEEVRMKREKKEESERFKREKK